MDVQFSPRVDLVADIHVQPFLPGTLDYLFSLAVFEHLRNALTAWTKWTRRSTCAGRWMSMRRSRSGAFRRSAMPSGASHGRTSYAGA
jgi:hypothetical protein